MIKRKLQSLPATLLASRHLDQVLDARETYLAVDNDDILHGFRKGKNLPAPGKVLGGWCSHDSGLVIGQWLSGFSRLGAALGDAALTDKAVRLFEGLLGIYGKDGQHNFGTYGFDKLVGGIVDLHHFTRYPDGRRFLGGLTEFAGNAFDRTRSPAGEIDWDGRHPHGTLEWYTLGENLYRAFEQTGDVRFKEFGDVWRYPYFWDPFRDSNRPSNAHTVHAYSHVNSFCSLVTAAVVDNDPALLQAAVNAHDYMTGTQCFCTGGFGPFERLLPIHDGRLGYSLDICAEHAEVGCGSWAAFKLSRYLLELTGECRFMDWAERVLHSCIGAALPVWPDGRTTYYADYRPSSSTRHYYHSTWPCCSGTYIQAVAAYHDLIYFTSPEALHVSLYLPSSVIEDGFTLTQKTDYPAIDTIAFTIDVPQPRQRALRFRIPAWCHGSRATVNGQHVVGTPGQWLEINRVWSRGDRVELLLPATPRLEAVDAFHSRRCAVVAGPLTLAQPAQYAHPLFIRDEEEFQRRLRRDDTHPLQYKIVTDFPQDLDTGSFRPLWDYTEGTYHRVYVDTDHPHLYGSWTRQNSGAQ